MPKAATENTTIESVVKTTDLEAENKTLKAKVAELEKLCKSFAEREQQTKTLLDKARADYNARINYMLDCVKHAYISMNFAVGTTNKEGDNK